MAEVKLTIDASDHAALRALLKYYATKIDEKQLSATLAALGYDSSMPLERQLPYIAERLANVIDA